jgi:superfamily II DNA or RNA helicase
VGDAARTDPLLRAVLRRNIAELGEMLERDTLSALAWMVADEVLTFKLALPHKKLAGGEFHDKFGVFTDAEGNQLSFNGSYNESIQGTRNYESIRIFSLWEPAFARLVQADVARFERLWRNEDPNVRVFDLPEAAREEILKLREGERPYPEPSWVKLKRFKEEPLTYQHTKPRIPTKITLRPYQEEAIDAWFKNGNHGLFEMATGTGKTITALAASIQLLEREKRLVIVISSPFIHLVSQWAENVEQFGYRYLTIPGTHRKWHNVLANELLDFSANYIDTLVILTTHDTFANPRFWEILEEKPLPLLLIADEVHELGAEKLKLGLRENYRYRLGLSATPQRYFDDEGTDYLFSFFSGTVFEFSLADAIPEYLTPYDYYPYFVELSGDELESYYEVTKKLSRRAFLRDDEEDETLQLYLILRQQIIVNAEAKYSCLANIISSLPDLSHTLVYCSPEQIDRAQAELNAQQIIQHRFTFEEDLGERERLLNSFSRGQHQVLVAMKCLDQGVDVPATENAIIMASTGNPKQFIQRRGRILRKYPGKKKASIYDIIVVPTLDGKLEPQTLELERKILRKELRRYNEFARLALNSTHALNKIAPIKRKYLLREDDE